MGKVKYATGIDYVEGSLAKPVKKEGHSHGTYLIGTHRKAETTNPNCTRLYIRDNDAYKRSTPVTRDELALRERFAEVSRAVMTRMHNLSTITTDQQAYLAQKDQPGGKKTFKKYIWSLELATYDTAHPRS